LGCGPALAHGGFDDQKLLWTGTMHVLFSPLSLAALAGLIVSASGIKEPWSLVSAIVAGVAAAGAAALPGLLPYWAAHAAIILLGLTAVSGIQPTPFLAALLSLCCGFAAGASAGLDILTTQALTGAAITVGFAVVAGMTGLADFSKVKRFNAVTLLARRVIGSWIAAIGLLMGALAIRMHHG